MYDYEKKPPEELGLELKRTADGVYKARDTAIKHLKTCIMVLSCTSVAGHMIDTKLVAQKSLRN